MCKLAFILFEARILDNLALAWAWLSLDLGSGSTLAWALAQPVNGYQGRL
jgi:hypothetical protein